VDIILFWAQLEDRLLQMRLIQRVDLLIHEFYEIPRNGILKNVSQNIEK
jgi:hypothetical protein